MYKRHTTAVNSTGKTQMLALPGRTLQKGLPHNPKQSSPPPKYKSTKENQHNLKKSFHKRFQDKSQINEICTPAGDNCNEEFNNFISEFENIMLEDSDDSSAWLAALNALVINEVFIDGFNALYNIQKDNLHTQALFDMGSSINAISVKFYISMHQHVKLLPTNRKLSLQMATAWPHWWSTCKIQIR